MSYLTTEVLTSLLQVGAVANEFLHSKMEEDKVKYISQIQFHKKQTQSIAASTIKLPHKIRKEAIDHVW